ncbi:MAG: ABC transporter substrate-binding protein [Trueperaceae bacterium]
MRIRRFGLLAILLVAGAVTTSALAQASPSGTLVVALDATPANLDQMSNTTLEVVFPAGHIYETLFAFDTSFRPQPGLVESYEVDETGSTWTFTLRQGVLFHNGDTMTVDDVEASYNRWRTTSQIARQWDDVIFERIDDNTFRLVSLTARGNMLFDLAQTSQALVISPAEVIEGVAANELTEYIGTGPFMFDSMVPDQYVRVRAFPDYVSRDEPSSGRAGGKEALVEMVEFRIIKDVPTRVAALRAGEIDVVPAGISGSDRPTLEADPDITVQIVRGFQKWGPIFNGARPLGGNQVLRQAVAAVLDHEELALAMVGDPDLFEIHPGLPIADSFFSSDVAADSFDQRDPDKARRLLEEAGYNGEELVIISTKSNVLQDKMATVMEAQLEEIGMNVRIDWYDGATIRQVRTQPDQWDIIPAGWGTTFDPAIYGQAFTCESGSWTGHCYPELDEIFERAAEAFDPGDRKEIYEELQRAMLEEFVPQILLADFHALRAYRSNLSGVQDYKDFIAWNVSKE